MDLYSEYIKNSEKPIVGKQTIQYKLGKRLGIEWPILASESPEVEEWRDPSTYAWVGIQPVDAGAPGAPSVCLRDAYTPLPWWHLSLFSVERHRFPSEQSNLSSYNELPLCFFSIFPLVGSLFIPHFWAGPIFWAGVEYTGSFPRHTGSSLCV